MAGFPIFDVHCNLVEKIASKLDGQSYLEMQQTCREMSELIRNNRKITAGVNKTAFLDWKKFKNGRMQLVVTVNGQDPLDLDSLYGVRFGDIPIIEEIQEEFEEFCATVKNYRITCEQLNLDYYFRDRDCPSKEQCIEILKTLKPSEVLMDSRNSNRFEALASWLYLKKINFIISPEDVLPALQILSGVSFIKLDVRSADEGEEYTAQQFCTVLERILQFLRSTALPNLCSFVCTMTCDEELPPIEERIRRLRDFQMTYVRGPDQYGRHVYECNALGQNLGEVALLPRGVEIVYDR